MPITITASPPSTYLPPGREGGQPIFSAPIGGSHINDASFVKTPTAIVPCVAGDNANICGIIQHDSGAVFDQQDTGFQGVFGVSQVGTGLFPQTTAQALVATLGPPVLAVANVTATTGWISGGATQVTYGTAVGLNIDGTTGFYVFDTTQTQVGNVVGVITGDGNIILGPPTAATPITLTGVLGVRVLVAFLTTVLNPIQGQ